MVMMSASMTSYLPMMPFDALILSGLNLEVAEDIFSCFVEDMRLDSTQNLFCAIHRKMGAVVEVVFAQVDVFKRNKIRTSVNSATPNFHSEEAWLIIISAIGDRTG